METEFLKQFPYFRYKIICVAKNKIIQIMNLWTRSKGESTYTNSFMSISDQLYLKNKKTNLMSLAILFHFLCSQHVSDINISIIRS